jgi:hypothetical protein
MTCQKYRNYIQFKSLVLEILTRAWDALSTRTARVDNFLQSCKIIPSQTAIITLLGRNRVLSGESITRMFLFTMIRVLKHVLFI